MGNYHLAPDPFHSGLGEPPLAGSMHAMVPYPHMPLNSQPQSTEVSLRITQLEQKQFHDGVDAHHRSVQTSQWMQHLQQQLHQLQYAVTYEIPTLRRQVQSLQARLERKENDECTRQIELEPRTREEKLHSALKNANLVRIYTSVSTHDNATHEISALRRAEQMEALATSLRGRVYRGGRAYLLEAEDAEAWAAKLREDARSNGQPVADNKLLMASKPADCSQADIENTNLETWEQPYVLTNPKGLDEQWIPAPQTKLASTSSGKHAVCTPVQDFDCTRNTIGTPKNVATPARSVPARSSIHPYTPSAQRSKSWRNSTAASRTVKEPSESRASPVQHQAVSELQSRKLAPHIKYAARQIQVAEDWTQATKATTNDGITKTHGVTNAPKVQVPSVVPPHRRLNKRETTLPTLDSDIEVMNHEIKGSVFDKTKSETSPVQQNVISVKKVPRKKHKKRASNRRNKSAKHAAPEPSPVEPIWTVNKNETWPSKAAKSNATSAEATIQSEMHETSKVEIEKESSLKADDEFSSKNQDDFVSTLNPDILPWQPAYLKELPLLSPVELEGIPHLQRCTPSTAPSSPPTSAERNGCPLSTAFPSLNSPSSQDEAITFWKTLRSLLLLHLLVPTAVSLPPPSAYLSPTTHQLQSQSPCSTLLYSSSVGKDMCTMECTRTSAVTVSTSNAATPSSLLI